MSTAAGEVLNAGNTGSASAGDGGSAGTTNTSGSGGTGNTGGAANATQFWSTWDKPEQKETRDWVANKNYADPFTLAKTAQGLEREAATLRAGKGYPVDKTVDGKVVRDDNAWKAWNTLVGVPETPEAYNLTPDPAFPQFTTAMAKEMQRLGVPAQMATQLQKAYDTANAETIKQLREKEDADSKLGLATLEREWGANYQERVALAQRGKEWLSKEVGGLNETQLRMLESTLGTAKFMSAMWKFGAGNKEASFAGGEGGSQFAGGASEARARLDQLTADRAAGKISDFEWRGKQDELNSLRDRIVAGMASTQ